MLVDDDMAYSGYQWRIVDYDVKYLYVKRNRGGILVGTNYIVVYDMICD
jgi:hypothetical protein